MKAQYLLAAMAAAMALSLPAAAAVDKDAATKMLKDNNCNKCHAVDKAKKGPAFTKTAAKYKGKADAETKLSEFLTSSPKVKLDDGTEEEHKPIPAKNVAGMKNLIQFILSQ